MPLFSSIADQSLSFLAYLDPGMGSMQFQLLLAGLLSATVFLKASCGQIRSLMGRFFKKLV